MAPKWREICRYFILSVLLNLCFSTLCVAGNIAAPSSQPFYFLTLSDIHFDPYTSCNTKPCLLITKLCSAPSAEWPRILSAYDNQAPKFRHDTNYALFMSALSASKEAADAKSSRFVLVLGDSLGHEYHSKYRRYSGDKSIAGYQSFVRKTLEFLTNKLNAAFPNSNIYILVGNNDSYQGDYYAIVNGQFFKDAAAIWSSGIKDATTRSSMRNQFTQGGYYSLTLPNIPDLRLIALNSTLFSTQAKGKNTQENALKQLDWLHSQLLYAKDHHQKVFIATHIPEGIDIYATLRTRILRLTTLWKQEYTDRFQSELAQFAPSIAGIFAGHLHSNWMQILTFNDSQEIPVNGIPSISPIFGNNPGFKIFSYANNPVIFNDYLTYYFPMNGTNTWTMAYDYQKANSSTIDSSRLAAGH